MGAINHMYRFIPNWTQFCALLRTLPSKKNERNCTQKHDRAIEEIKKAIQAVTKRHFKKEPSDANCLRCQWRRPGRRTSGGDRTRLEGSPLCITILGQFRTKILNKRIRTFSRSVGCRNLIWNRIWSCIRSQSIHINLEGISSKQHFQVDIPAFYPFNSS